MLQGKLAVAVTFFYNEDRLDYLKKTCSSLSSFASEVTLFIVTNTDESKHHDKIISQMPNGLLVEIKVPKLLGHPFLLTWAHFSIFKNNHLLDNYDYFMYLEDDIYLNSQNISYWARSSEFLSKFGLIPAFIRYEIIGQKRYATDWIKKSSLRRLKIIKSNTSYLFFQSPYPYQGMYLLANSNLREFFDSPASNPDRAITGWGIREKATQGATFVNIPPDRRHRLAVGFDASLGVVDEGALVHHLPNNYALDCSTRFASIEVQNIITSRLLF